MKKEGRSPFFHADGATRRGVLAGALGVAAAPVLRADAAAPAIPRAKRKVVLRGRAIAASDDGRTLLVAHDRRRTVAIHRGKSTPRVVDVGGQPLDVAIARDGRTAAVSTGFWDKPGLTIVDLAGGAVRLRRTRGPAPGALEFTADGGRLVVTGGEQEGTLHVLETAGFRTVAHAVLGRCPRDLAITADGRHAWVALAADDRVVLVDLRSGRIRRELNGLALPDRVALSPRGRRLLVSHARGEAVTELDLRSGARTSHTVGRHPSGVAWAGGQRLVALGGEDAVVRIGGRRHAVGPAPRGLVVAGRRFWTVSNLTGAIHGGRA